MRIIAARHLLHNMTRVPSCSRNQQQMRLGTPKVSIRGYVTINRLDELRLLYFVSTLLRKTGATFHR